MTIITTLGTIEVDLSSKKDRSGELQQWPYTVRAIWSGILTPLDGSPLRAEGSAVNGGTGWDDTRRGKTTVEIRGTSTPADVAAISAAVLFSLEADLPLSGPGVFRARGVARREALDALKEARAANRRQHAQIQAEIEGLRAEIDAETP